MEVGDVQETRTEVVLSLAVTVIGAPGRVAATTLDGPTAAPTPITFDAVTV